MADNYLLIKDRCRAGLLKYLAEGLPNIIGFDRGFENAIR
jgi:hypothetical protein